MSPDGDPQPIVGSAVATDVPHRCDGYSSDLDTVTARPVMSAVSPKERVRPSVVVAHQEQFDHHACDHDGTLVREPLPDDLLKLVCGYEPVYSVEGFALDEEVDIVVRARRA